MQTSDQRPPEDIEHDNDTMVVSTDASTRSREDNTRREVWASVGATLISRPSRHLRRAGRPRAHRRMLQRLANFLMRGRLDGETRHARALIGAQISPQPLPPLPQRPAYVSRSTNPVRVRQIIRIAQSRERQIAIDPFGAMRRGSSCTTPAACSYIYAGMARSRRDAGPPGFSSPRDWEELGKR